jgi:predicted HD phosphohydrolase
MDHRLRQAFLHVTEGSSVVAPLIIEGLPARIEALGASWHRKREFHLTAVSAATLERAGRGRPDLWQVVTEVASGRVLGPITAGPEVRRVSNPERPGLHTLIVMADAAGLAALHRDLSAALGVPLEPPPAHVTLYASDPGEGIGIDDEQQLRERAPALEPERQDEVRRAMRLGDVLFDDGGIPSWSDDEAAIAFGDTDRVFTPRSLAALVYAAHVHRDQRRKATGIPYLAHLISVAALVAEDGGGETEVIAALLHDTAEDHGGEGRLADVRRRFGAELEMMVRALSDSLRPEGTPKERWRVRKERYLDHLRHEGHEGVLRVSNADKLHNARAILADHRQIGPAIWKRFDGRADEQLWYYSELATIFEERRAGSALARELSETVRQLRAAIP